ncbi:MAG: hypothetical protein ACRC8S_06830 [Fimbriiglobus sp.]
MNSPDPLSELYQEHRPQAPSGFADRVAAVALRQRAVRLWWRRAGAVFLTGLLILGGATYFFWPSPDAPEPITQTVPIISAPETTAPSPISEGVTESREALQAVREKVRETASLIRPPELFTTKSTPETPELPPITPKTIDPITGTTRRAMSMFFQDIKSLTHIPPEMR